MKKRRIDWLWVLAAIAVAAGAAYVLWPRPVEVDLAEVTRGPLIRNLRPRAASITPDAARGWTGRHTPGSKQDHRPWYEQPEIVQTRNVPTHAGGGFRLASSQDEEIVE